MNTEIKAVLRTNKKTKKKVILLLTSTIFLSIVIVFVLSLYVGWNLTHPKVQPISDNPSNYGLSYKNISFMSEDNKTKLEGWVMEPPTQPKMSIIFSHGYRKNRYHDSADFLALSKELVSAGYRVVMFDYRNSGNSEGEVTTVGINEKDDLLGAIHWAAKHYEEPIGLYGGSMGAATALVAAGEEKEVIGVVADSPFSDLKGYLEENLSVWSHLPKIPFTPTILFLLPAVLDIDPAKASPIHSLQAISPRPVLFIHGNNDKKIPYTESVKMVDTNRAAFELWIPKGVDHVAAFKTYPKEYTERIISFFERTLHNQTIGL